MTRRGLHNTIGGSRAFTLIEVVVAVGILALIGVLVGSVFATVGDTVTQGRRVSNMNRFASRIERVMRRDFENMVRENGFLVIRNEVTHDYSTRPVKVDVGLTITDPAPRERRIDEIMFFSRGDFSSRRTPLHRDMVARSTAARVYYGHGQKMPVDFGADPDRPDYTTRFARPRLDEPNSFTNARLGAPSALGAVNPNEFAADWSLLRHVTVLTPRPGGLQDLPDDVFGLRPTGTAWQDYNRVADSSRQVALGPAAQSVFRSVAHMVPYELVNRPDTGASTFTVIDEPDFNIRPEDAFAAVLNNGNDGAADGTLVRPLFTSGVVDVAVTDLDEIRTTVMSTWFGAPNNPRELLPSQLTPYDYTDSSDRLAFEQDRVLFDNTGRQRVGSALLSTGMSVAGSRPQAQQLWMLDAMPSTPFDPAEPDDTGFRVRYEDAPPRVDLDDGTLTPDRDDRIRRAVEQADQEMLGSSVFLPRCTEFIVEFSLGIIDRRDPGDNPNYGRLIWHGLRRYRDHPTSGNVGRYDEGGNNADTDDTLFADYFGAEYDGADLIDEADEVDDRFNIRGVFGDWFFDDGVAPQNPVDGSIDPEMLQLVRVDQRFNPNMSSNVEDAAAAEYCFGYVYRDANAPANFDDDTVRPWPWPRLIRVTMRFVDPSDLETERTYQAEFRVPTLAGEM